MIFKFTCQHVQAGNHLLRTDDSIRNWGKVRWVKASWDQHERLWFQIADASLTLVNETDLLMGKCGGCV